MGSNLTEQCVGMGVILTIPCSWSSQLCGGIWSSKGLRNSTGTGLSLGLTVPGTLGSKLRSLESKQWPWSHRMVRGLTGEIIMTFGQTVALWWPQKDSLSRPGHLLPQSTDRFKGESMKKAPAGGGGCEAMTRSWLQSHLNHGTERWRSKVRSCTGLCDKTCPVQEISSQLQPLRLKEAQKSSITYHPRCHHTEQAQQLPLL